MTLEPGVEQLSPTEADARARGVLWDALVGSTMGMGIGFALFVENQSKPPWVPFIIAASALGISAVAYWPRDDEKSDSPYRRWLRTATPFFHVVMLWLLVGTAALSLYDSKPGTDLAALAAKRGLSVAGFVAGYCVFLRPGLPWVKPVETPRLWAVVVLSAVLLGLAVWVAPPMGLFQVPLFTILWASAG